MSDNVMDTTEETARLQRECVGLARLFGDQRWQRINYHQARHLRDKLDALIDAADEELLQEEVEP